MSSTTREQVRAALDALRVGRTPGAAKRYARSLLARYGDGAPDIEHLAPAYFGAVFAAAGGNLPPVNPSPQVYRHGGHRIRPRTPLVLDLERRLREGPKNRRPMVPVDYGNRSLPGERRD
jgi:hypothetical protein